MSTSDCNSNEATIRVENNKNIFLDYGLGPEDFGEFASQVGDPETPDSDDEEVEALIQRVSDAFELPFPDIEKSLIGPNVINNWQFIILKRYSSIPYKLLKYVLLNSPRLQFFELIICILVTTLHYHLHQKSAFDINSPKVIHPVLLKNI